MHPSFLAASLSSFALALAGCAVVPVPVASPASSAQALAPAPAPTGSHTHGVATAEVRYAYNQLLITLNSPTEHLLGFEGMPQTPNEKEQIQKLADKLMNPALMFVPDAKARCRSTSTQVAPPTYGGNGHSDVTVDYRFECGSMPTAIGVMMFDTYRNLRQLNVNVAVPRILRQLALTPGQDILLQ